MSAASAFVDDDLQMPRRRHLRLAAVDGCIVEDVTDSFGYHSGATYDYALGVELHLKLTHPRQ